MLSILPQDQILDAVNEAHGTEGIHHWVAPPQRSTTLPDIPCAGELRLSRPVSEQSRSSESVWHHEQNFEQNIPLDHLETVATNTVHFVI